MGLCVVFTNGVFDLVHPGHLASLEQARALGDVLIVGINSDDSTRRIKGPHRPLIPEDERATLLAAFRCVDYVTIFAELTAESLVATLQPDIYVKGGDYAAPRSADHGTIDSDGMVSQPHHEHSSIDLHRLPEAVIVESYGGRVVLIPYRDGHSTTDLITRIMERFRSPIS